MERLERPNAVTIVQAPPGYGKTALLSDWAARTPTARIAPAEDLLPRLAEGAGGTIVVDDFARHETAALAENIVTALGRPGAPRLVVATRSTPLLRMYAWDRGLDVGTVGAADLLATETELADMASAWGAAGAADLHAPTGGWPRVARLLAEEGAAGDYLRDAVLARLDRETLAFALALSANRRLAPAHRRVSPGTGAPASDAFERLLDAGVVQRRPDGSDQVAPVMAAALRRLVPAEEALPWHRALVEELGHDGDAASLAPQMEHARASRDWAVLAQLWTRHGLRLLEVDESAVERVYGDVPAAAIAAWPALTLPVATARAMREKRPFHDVQPVMWEAARRTAQQFEGPGMDHGGDLEKYIFFAATALVDARMDGRWEEQRRIGEAAEERYRAERGSVPDSQRYAWFLLQVFFGEVTAGESTRAKTAGRKVHLVSHDAPESRFSTAAAAAAMCALATLEGAASDAAYWGEQYAAVTREDAWGYGYATSLFALVRAMRAVDRLDLAAAEAALAEAGDPRCDFEFWPFALVPRTQLALLRGEPADMLDEIGHVVATHQGQYDAGGWGTRVVACLRVELLTALGEVGQALEVAESVAGESTAIVPLVARAHLVAGDAARAYELARQPRWDADVTPRTRLGRLLVTAAAAEQLGDHRGADAAFSAAVALSGTTGLMATVVKLPRSVRRTLLERHRRALSEDSLERLFEFREVFETSVEPVRLTPRERVVLKEMARSTTLQEIAKKLTVSANTVKKQAISVYSKLGVHDREAALERARALGLLPPLD
ncbi:hypothetical protein GCM10008096_02050 [Zhihengliuella salsuginis]|uniref:HTH luxR-type domain-containing protein n=1 Tax=Zhihengliuella salsuginis TaxID=578222 RepID=A0ABQ3GBV2_9MICC|nr:hypothetical protein GCM10008096_02050 [Zhihengliuella salsuginis]